MRVLIFVFALVVLPPLGAVLGQADRGSPLRLVILPPWQDGAALVRDAGGTLIGPEKALLGMLAQADDVASFDRNARALGAWWVSDGAAIAAICGVTA